MSERRRFDGPSVAQQTGDYFIRRTFIAGSTAGGLIFGGDTRRVAIVFMRIGSGADIVVDTQSPGPSQNGFGLTASTPLVILKWTDVASLLHSEWHHGGTPLGVALTAYEVLQTRA